MVNCMSWSLVESNLNLAASDIYADHLPISILNQITWPYNEYHLEPSIIIKSVIKCVLTVSGSTLGKKASWVSLKQTQKTHLNTELVGTTESLLLLLESVSHVT